MGLLYLYLMCSTNNNTICITKEIMRIMEGVKNVVFKKLPFVSSFVLWLVSFIA